MFLFNTSLFIYDCVCVSGWPGATHSVDICEDLEDWSGANLSNISDTEEEDTVRLVSVFNLTLQSPAIMTNTGTVYLFPEIFS